MGRRVFIQLLLGLFLSQLSFAEANDCETELALACVFGVLCGLIFIGLLLYCCFKQRHRRRQERRGKQRMSASLEEGDGVFGGSSTHLSLGLNGGEKYQHEPSERLLCSQCHQRMERASVDIEMPVASTNTAYSVSEDNLPISGNSVGLVSPDEPRVYVFVEKPTNDSLGLYLVPFEDDPLTGLYVKTVVPGKSAARLSVFEPGDKIVTVNGKPLRGLSYLESTNFIRQCPGPNVKMGIVKHALYKMEDLERLDSLSVFQRPSVGDAESPEMRSTGRISTSHDIPGVDFHPSNVHGGIDASGAPREVMIDNLEIITKTDTSLNVQSLPDFFFEEEGSFNTDKDGIQFESNFPHSGPEVDFGSKGEGDVGIGGNSNFSPEFPGIGSAGKDVEFDVKHGAAVGQPRVSGTAEIKNPTFIYDKSSPQRRRHKISKGCRRSRSNPQLRPRQETTDQGGDDAQSVRFSPLETPLSASGNVYPFSGRDRTVTVDCYVPPLGTASAFRSNNLCAKGAPLLQRHAEPSRNVLKSYLVPLSDFSGTSGMLKSKSLDKLDEIMRNDPILRDDYYARAALCSRSTQTQTDERYTKKKPRRPRNDRPHSQILPPTYLQLPSVTWLAGELSDANAKGQAQQSKHHEVENVWGENYPQCTPRRKSKQEQAQIVQRWITEVIEHKREQELQKQSVKPAVGREKSTKLKKKSRSVPEHAFRGKLARFDHEDCRRASDDSDAPSDQCKRQRNDSDEKSPDVFFPRLRHAGSDPNFKSAMSRRTRDETFVSASKAAVGTSGQQSAGTSPICEGERISPSLQSRIRSLNESFQGNNQSPSLQVNSSPQMSDGQAKRLKISNPDLPLISRLLSDKELDSEC